MIKTYAFLFIILCTIYITSSNTVNITDVFFDKKLDIIFHKGKLYLPKLHPLIPNEVPESHEKNQHDLSPVPHSAPHEEHGHEHEFVDGNTFWIYIVAIGCKKLF